MSTMIGEKSPCVCVLILVTWAGLTCGISEVSQVEVDLDTGLVTGYSDRVTFLSTPTATPTPLSDAGKRCGRQAVIRVELGGTIQVAKIELKYKNPQLWTFHLSDTLMADGYGDVFIQAANTTSTTEMFVSNQQLRIYTHFPQQLTSSWTDLQTGSAQWMYLRVVDDTVQKEDEILLTIDLKSNTMRWQDGRMAHDFLAPPGFLQENGVIKENIVVYIAMNRILADTWRFGSGLCHLTLKLMDNDEDQCEGEEVDCDPNAVCKHTKRFHRCSCRKGWEGDGKTCRDIDECRLRNGGCVHLCHNHPGNYSCSCLRGFVTDPEDEHNCLDVNECAAEGHGCAQQCVNTVGSHECECADNRTAPFRRHCQREDSPCLKHGCQHTCVVGHYGNVIACSCWTDYQLDLTDGKSCIRKCRLGNGGCQHHCLDTETGPICTCQFRYLLGLDVRKCTASCSVNNGGCQKRCANTDVGVICSCPSGYILNGDGRTCSDLDECATNNGGCQHQCLNGNGYFECTCPRGYRIDPADETTCVDVDECSVNDTCEHTCTNVPGSYSCSCDKGYHLFGVAHCGEIGACHSPDQACAERCDDPTFGGDCKSSDSAKKLLNRLCPENTTETTIARARVSFAGMACSQSKDVKSYAKEFLEVFKRTLTRDCDLQVVNVKCLPSKHTRSENETVKVGLKMICVLSDEVKSCGLQNCSVTAVGNGSAMWKTISILRESFNNDLLPRRIRNYELSIEPKSFHVRQKTLRQICSHDHHKKLFLKHNVTAVPFSPSSTYRKKIGKCSPGHVWNDDLRTCTACVKGTYHAGRNLCVACPENSTTDFEAAKSIDSCKRFQCTSYINDLKGWIETPNYPGNYPNHVECTWVIKPPKGRRLLVIIPELRFAGSKCADHLMMRKSKSPYSVVTFEACKSMDGPLAFVAESQRLWIQFKSDGSDSSSGFHIPFVTYNEEYQALIEDIVQDRRLYSSQNHLEILRDKKLLDALIEVIAQPINYYKYSNDQRKMFPSSFIRLMTPKVRKFFSYRRRR